MQDYFSLPIEPEDPEREYNETRKSLESCITGISSLTESLGITLRHQQDDQSLLDIYREFQHTFEHTSTQFHQQENSLDAIMTKLEFSSDEKQEELAEWGSRRESAAAGFLETMRTQSMITSLQVLAQVNKIYEQAIQGSKNNVSDNDIISESYLKEVQDARRMAEEFGSLIQASVYQASEDSPLGKAFQSYCRMRPQVDELTSQPESNTAAEVAGSSNDVEMDYLADLLATKFTAA
ncbi:hypothetical protein L486_04612 [Kwoniella mangroviensis CBS 10435]|uniref:Uncharacterized protein n=1 Tax=Kwoniella mangroviensis CBS 10435 TaxID=1331196 RepID=A0A1B9INP7_9TREE|nr:hypothetical protein L486_04612 [Kwoniella mangroviensis CBS 10435]